MHPTRHDRLARVLRGTPTRRVFTRVLAGISVASAVGLPLVDDGAAKKKKKKKSKSKAKGSTPQTPQASPPSPPAPPPQIYQFVTAWGSFGTGNGQFLAPRGLAVDESGQTTLIYVVDEGNYVQAFTSDGGFVRKWGEVGTLKGEFSFPNDAAVDSVGNVFVADSSNNRIQKMTSTGEFIAKLPDPPGSLGTSAGSGNGQFSLPWCIATDGAGSVYVADSFNHRNQKFTSNLGFITAWGSQGAATSQFDLPVGIAVDSVGNAYVADTNNNRIQKFDSDGGFLTAWGSFGSDPGEFSPPNGVAVDTAGNVYVSDTFNYRIQKFTGDGALLTQWGSQGTGNGQFDEPDDVAVDSAGNVYVIDRKNFRIQKFALAAAARVSAQGIGHTSRTRRAHRGRGKRRH